jgi:hypothetical protein
MMVPTSMRCRSLLAGLGFLALFATCACSKSGSDGQPAAPSPDAGDFRGPTPQRIGSCDRAPTTGTCSEYGGPYLVQNEALLTASCARLGGTFVYAECPNTSNVGSCTLSTGEVRKFYGTGASAFEPERARTECEKTCRGAWQAHR